MRKALVVGINFYEHTTSLHGCVNDAYSVKGVLDRNFDSTINFDIKLETAVDENSKINRSDLKKSVQKLFADDAEIALFYFSGHGYVESTGGYLITSDCREGDAGLPLTDVLQLANNSKAKNRIVVLDCCHAGFAGKLTGDASQTSLNEGVTVLTASTEEQYALEENGEGVFTKLFVDALEGGAANLLGEITPGSVYAHIDQSLGLWEQRPVFKTNVKNFTSLRKVKPSISIDDLREIINLFPTKSEHFSLDPTFEPEEASYNEENGKKFALLQKYNRVNLVVPINAEHMYFAAIESKSCKLTILGEHYWNLVKKGRI
ncbi:MAG: peptidase C14 [Gammaproteobacteria bacterium]|nr:MAG: peptidase C14 [Gammaproteobacteria bacterium]